MPDTQTPFGADEQVLVTWQAPVLPTHERGRRWYTIGGAVVLGGAAYGILTGSWPFAIVALLCGAMYYLVRDHVPSLKTITLSDSGVMLEKTFTRWDDLKGFWLLETAEYTELHFTQKAPLRSDIVIQTGSQDNGQLRILLSAKIPELKEKRETFLDAFIRTAKL